MEKKVEDVIIMDVHRSFTLLKSIDPAALINILKTYAYYDPNIQYCQGMNFIVGFLYLLLQDESLSFNFLNALIEKFKMGQLYSQDVPLLRAIFYQMDRLIYLHYPHLTSGLRNEGINSSHFTSAWFITLFTYSLQYSKDEKPSEMLMTIWNGFLLYGWKAIFKTALFIIGEFEERILEGKFDEVMVMLGDLPKSTFMYSHETAVKLKASFRKIKVTKRMLAYLYKEYCEVIEKVKNQTKTQVENGFSFSNLIGSS